MGTQVQQACIDAHKAEIDTRAPFQSVKAAVSLFGEVAFTSTVRKPKAPPIEIIPNINNVEDDEVRALTKETQLDLAKKELNKYKEQLHNAETTRIQALVELEGAKRTVEELTKKLNEINESALKATEDAKSQTKKLEDATSVESIGKNSGKEQEFDNAREQYAVAIAELDAAKQELRTVKREFDASMEVKLNAIQQEDEAKKSFDANTNRVAELSKEISAAQDSLTHVKLATNQARQELKIRMEKDATPKSYKQALEGAEKKLASLKKEFDPEVNKNLEAKLAETNAEIEAVQKELEDARISASEFVTTLTSELDGAKGMLQKLVEEESSLRSLVESLKLELEAVQEEHAELKEKDAETESVVSNLHVKLQNCKAELEAAVIAESKATLASDDLVSALQQLSSESLTALQEAEEIEKTVEEQRGEAKVAQTFLVETEEKLQVALKSAEEAKAAETRALDLIKKLSLKTNVAQASASESGANVTISKEEYEALTRKAEESEKLTEIKVAAALAQVEVVRASETEAIKKLDAARKEIEDMETATEEALKRAEIAEAAKKAVEGELKKWHEKELKRVAETASMILAETQISTETLPPKSMVQNVKTLEKTHGSRKVSKQSSSRKSLFQNLSSIFHRKKSQIDGSSLDYPPCKKHV
ncbi:hypothetical protein ZIOFF_061334 [Zingiber officinale]|uniref:WEB family protein n=1 Tax=Zingiber officinale TaxID=94328 RepID=A0A8J5F496_ZINOF|nr:hypothetical protein ZIOFF_061334 [Zingiber officinale]